MVAREFLGIRLKRAVSGTVLARTAFEIGAFTPLHHLNARCMYVGPKIPRPGGRLPYGIKDFRAGTPGTFGEVSSTASRLVR
jgi:hypothetical protein